MIINVVGSAVAAVMDVIYYIYYIIYYYYRYRYYISIYTETGIVLVFGLCSVARAHTRSLSLSLFPLGSRSHTHDTSSSSSSAVPPSGHNIRYISRSRLRDIVTHTHTQWTASHNNNII